MTHRLGGIRTTPEGGAPVGHTEPELQVGRCITTSLLNVAWKKRKRSLAPRHGKAIASVGLMNAIALLKIC
ncbi:hypothetical protein [Microseira wollei]|uniref:hypothetical protein n=1 Tax=Microseira wollei TaxID=467598 RepID=UPI001CFE5602|nr:hypothetical protein [Microseira wollei]